MAISRIADLSDNTNRSAASSYTFAIPSAVDGQIYAVNITYRGAADAAVDAISGTNGFNGTFVGGVRATDAAAISLTQYFIAAVSGTAGDIVVSFNQSATGAQIIVDTDPDWTSTTLPQAQEPGSTTSATSITPATALDTFDSAGNTTYVGVAKSVVDTAFVADGSMVMVSLTDEDMGESPGDTVSNSLSLVGQDTTPSASWTNNARAVCVAAEVSTTAAGGGGVVVPVFEQTYRRRRAA